MVVAERLNFAPEGLFGHGVADMLTLNEVCKTDVGGRYAYNSYHLPRRGNPVMDGTLGEHSYKRFAETIGKRKVIVFTWRGHRF